MDEQKKEILRGVMWDMNQITYRSVTAVSYTHLDVYKRQVCGDAHGGPPR